MLNTAHMIEGSSRLALFSQLASDAPSTVDVQIAMCGTWVKNGRSFTIDDDVINVLLANHGAQASETPADYEHLSLKREATPEQRRASGWIKSLTKRTGTAGSELWATVELTPDALRMVRAKEYRYASPVIDFDAVSVKGKKIGPELVNFALTNKPFLDGIAAIECSKETSMADEEKPDDKEEKPVAASEDVPPAADEPSSTAVLDALGKALGTDASGAAKFVADHMEAIVALANQVIESSDKPDDEKPIEASRDVVALLNERVVLLASRVKELEAKGAKDAATEFSRQVDEAIEAGKVNRAERPRALEAFSKSPEAARIAYLSRSEVVAASTAPKDRASDFGVRKDPSGKTIVEMSKLPEDLQESMRVVVRTGGMSESRAYEYYMDLAARRGEVRR